MFLHGVLISQCDVAFTIIASGDCQMYFVYDKYSLIPFVIEGLIAIYFLVFRLMQHDMFL